MILIDSNIWNYYFDKSSREHEYVIRPLEEFIEKEDIVINTVIVMEVSHFLIKNLGATKGKEKIEIFLELPLRIIDFDFSLMKESLEMLCKYSHLGIGGRDSTILATLKKVNCKKIFTHDKSFKKIKWLKVFDPIP
jgi:predicted nucleic acid-binding protein